MISHVEFLKINYDMIIFNGLFFLGHHFAHSIRLNKIFNLEYKYNKKYVYETILLYIKRSK